MTTTHDDHVEGIAQDIQSKGIKLTSEQIQKLKQGAQEAIKSLTSGKLQDLLKEARDDQVKITAAHEKTEAIKGQLRTNIVTALEEESKESDTPGVQDEEITAAIQKAVEKTQTTETQAEPTTAPTPENPPTGVQGVAEAVTHFSQGRPEEALNALNNTGIMPENFMKKIMRFFHEWLGDKRISYDQKTMFDNVVSKYLKDKGYDLTVTSKTKNNENIASIDKEARVKIMQKLSTLGVPVEESGNFFAYIMGDKLDGDIARELFPLFEAGKNHFKSMGMLNTTTPLSSVLALLDFTPPSKTDTPVLAGTTPEPGKETVPTATEVKFTKDGKETIVEAEPATLVSFTNIRKSAETILGKEYKIEDKIAEAYGKNTEADPKKKGEAVLKEVAITLVTDIRKQTALLGAEITKAEKEGKTVSLEDGTFTGDLVPAIEQKLTTYLPLAFDTLSKRVIAKTEEKLKAPDDTVEPLLAAYKEARESVLASIVGNYIQENQVNHGRFTEQTKNGYTGVFTAIIEQAKKIEAMKVENLNSDLLAAYKANSPLAVQVG